MRQRAGTREHFRRGNAYLLQIVAQYRGRADANGQSAGGNEFWRAPLRHSRPRYCPC